MPDTINFSTKNSLNGRILNSRANSLINSFDIKYIYQVSKRKTVGLKIQSKDTVKVSFPPGYKSQAEAFVLKKQAWIIKKLTEIQSRTANTIDFESLMNTLQNSSEVEQKVNLILDRLIFWKRAIAARYKEVDRDVLAGLAFTTSYWGICQTRQKKIIRTSFIKTNLSQDDLSNSNLSNSNPSKVNLRGVGLSQTNLRETNLRENNLLALEKTQIIDKIKTFLGINSKNHKTVDLFLENSRENSLENMSIKSLPAKQTLIKNGNSSKNNQKIGAKILINASMIFLIGEIEVLDYLCIHELCHLRVSGHGQKFWDMVGEFCPNYKVLRKSLKKHSHLLDKNNISQLKKYFSNNWASGFFDIKI
jgi:predicted metal-dependent hydrolase